MTTEISGTVTVPAPGVINSITSNGSMQYNGTTTLGAATAAAGPFPPATSFNVTGVRAPFTIVTPGSESLLENGVVTLTPTAAGQAFVIDLPAGDTFSPAPEPAALGLLGLGCLGLLARCRTA